MKQKLTHLIYCVFLFTFMSSSLVYGEVEFYLENIEPSTVMELGEQDNTITVETTKVSSGKWSLPSVTAHSAILMDITTGDILYAREAKKQRPIASTTKIMTTMLALELANMDETATVSEKAGKVGDSSIYLSKGDRIKLGELVEGALIRSGNDACVAIAEQTAGSLDAFIEMMNKKAIALGAYQTNFENPHGLPNPNHYSTAYDLAIMTRYALSNPEFSKIVRKKVGTISFEKPQKSQSGSNTNKLLFNYAYADGVKTGTTNAAGKCLVASATKDDRRLICVVLNAPDRFGDAKRLLEWGFNHTEIVNIGKKGEFVTNYPGVNTPIPVILESDVNVCVEKSKITDIRKQTEFVKGIYPPIKAGAVLGKYNIYLGEKLIKEIPLVAREDFIGNSINFSGNLNIIIEQVLDLIKQKV